MIYFIIVLYLLFVSVGVAIFTLPVLEARTAFERTDAVIDALTVGSAVQGIMWMAFSIIAFVTPL